MNKRLMKLMVTVFAFMGLMVNLVAPVAAQTVSGNNTNSENYINVDLDQDKDVNQENVAKVNNNVTVSLSSGKNTVKSVVGGDVSVDTGKVDAGVKVVNNLNTNVASIEDCNSCGLMGDFKITNNNTKTDNDIKYDYDSVLDLDQKNDAKVSNDIDVTGESGKNLVKDVVGGDVSVDTGKVVINPVIVRNTLNVNYAMVKSSGNGEGPSAWVTGNNSKSKNFIDLDVDKDVDLDQDNDADVTNDVNVGAYSGWNKAKSIAGAGVSIDTGDVEVGILVDTMANFNIANVEDCCLLDNLDLKISDNNTSTDNDIRLDADLDFDLDQENVFGCGGYEKNWDPRKLFFGKGKPGNGGGECNDIDVTGGSGENLVKDSTAEGHDPDVDTGDVSAAIEVYNQANVNVDGGAFDLPDNGGNGGSTTVDIDLDFGELIDLLKELIGLLG